MRQLTTAALAAKEIRKELKAAFMKVKFYVKSNNYSMGDSVAIDWVDGPTADEVDNITAKYQYGHFNGMEDIYENSNSRDDIPQTKFVQLHREMSRETKAIIINEIKTVWAGMENFTEESWCEKAHCWGQQFIYRLFIDRKIA